MPLKISIGRKTADAVDGVRVGVSTGAKVGVEIGRAGDVVVGLEQRAPIQIELKARRTLEGNILIMDHESIDIVLMPEKNKCMAFAKNVLHEDVYGAQDRLASFMSKRGIIDLSKVRSGNIFGSMEYSITESKIPGIDQTQACIYTIYKYIQAERPYFDLSGAHKDSSQKHLLNPDDEFSTDLGDVPQADFKGSVDSRVRPFGYQYNYSLIREDTDN